VWEWCGSGVGVRISRSRMGDRVRVHLERPNEVHRASGGGSVALGDVRFEVIERRRLLESKSSVLVVDIMNTEAAVVNALRRIMLAEVETVAVDVVGLSANSSIIPDEVLAHRIGLVPFNIDPATFPRESINFDLYYECLPESDGIVKSGHFELGKEDEEELQELFAGGMPRPGPLHDDIVLAKLIPGQKIWLRVQLRRGEGKEHAKFSPVATASYRLMPRIEVNQKLAKDQAEAIKSSCPKDVFDIEDSGDLVAARPRDCTMCRECIRQPGWGSIVTLERDTSHYIMSIEGVGMIEPEQIFVRACAKLKSKALALAEDLALLE